MDPLKDIPKELSDYLPPLTRRHDFDAFWQQTIETARAVPLNIRMDKIDYPVPGMDTFDVRYNGFDTTDICSWYLRPTGSDSRTLPCLIHYHGFGGDRGRPTDYLQWIMMGMAVISIDCREQRGDTGNSAPSHSGMVQNLFTKGLLDKNDYYFRSVYMDALKAVDLACSLPDIDTDRIIIEGGSQGGILVHTTAAFDDRIWLGLADVPSNSNIEKRIERGAGAFAAVKEYLKHYPGRIEQVFETLSYYDTMNMAEKIKAEMLVSVGLQDPVASADCYFATYNRITAEKEVRLYPFNGHEGGHWYHNEEKLRWVKKRLGTKEV